MNSLTTVDPRINWDKKIPIIDEPVTIRVKEFTEESAETFSKNIDKAHNTSQHVVPVIIDSYGGDVYSLLSMIADIQNSSLPVATICIGKAMSCGAVLLTCGNEGLRFCDKNATVMLHEVSSVQIGKNEEIKASSKQTDKLNKQIFKIMAKNCGKDQNYFLNKIHERKNAEWFLSPQEAKKEKIIDNISIPHFSYNISLNIEFRDKNTNYF